MNFGYFMPEISFFGSNAIQELILRIKKRGYNKALIITDNYFNTKTNFIKNLQLELKSNNIESTVFDNVSPNPTQDEVMEGVTFLKESQSDIVIGFGGGSPNDAAKIISLIHSNGGLPSDYEGVNKSQKRCHPLAVINTTSGTATEITKNAVITNKEKNLKMVIIDENITPMFAVNDPNITKLMPKSLTANSGMDALTHAIESYMTTHNNPITTGLALTAIELIMKNLPIVCENLGNLEAREGMIYGQYIAGMSFNSGGLGLVHAMSHPISAHWGIEHGLSNAILLPHILRLNLEYAPGKAKKMAFSMGEQNFVDEKTSIKFIVNSIFELSKKIGIPKNLKSVGLDNSKFNQMAKDVLNDPCYSGNPRSFKIKEIIDIYNFVLEF